MIIQSESKLLKAIQQLVESKVSLQGISDPKEVISITFETCIDLGLFKDDSVKQASVESEQTPAVPIDESIQDDFIICLEDGKRFKMMKRHLRETYGMTPDQYRNKWGLPSDYPMTAPNYSKYKASYAKNSGLGKYEREIRLCA